jgi:hypothetical protein
MNNKVWVVIYNAYGDLWVEAVFSTKELAEDFREGELCYDIHEVDFHDSN